MDADKSAAILECRRQRSDRQGRGVGAEDRPLAQHVLRARNHFLFDLAVFEHRLDDELAVFELDEIGGRIDPRQQRVAVGGGGAAAIDLIGH